MNSDFKDLLRAFAEENVKFLVVGGYAVIHHAQPRYTKDLDLWVEPTPENARKLMKAFLRFGLPLIGLNESDFAAPGTQFSIGVPPCEIALLTSVPGLEFTPCWDNRDLSEEDDTSIPYLSKSDLIIAKKPQAAPRISPTSPTSNVLRTMADTPGFSAQCERSPRAGSALPTDHGACQQTKERGHSCPRTSLPRGQEYPIAFPPLPAPQTSSNNPTKHKEPRTKNSRAQLGAPLKTSTIKNLSVVASAKSDQHSLIINQIPPTPSPPPRRGLRRGDGGILREDDFPAILRVVFENESHPRLQCAG